MNPTIQIDLLNLIALCVGCVSGGMFIGMLTICVMVSSGRRDRAHRIGINQPPTTPKPDIIVKPQTELREGNTKSGSKEPSNTPRPTNPPPSQGNPQRKSNYE